MPGGREMPVGCQADDADYGKMRVAAVIIDASSGTRGRVDAMLSATTCFYPFSLFSFFFSFFLCFFVAVSLAGRDVACLLTGCRRRRAAY